jgi:hypothetical protein
MKKRLFILLGFCLPLFCWAQVHLPRVYEYDEAGNRVLHKVIYMQSAPPAPPEDSLQSLPVTSYGTHDELPSIESQQSPEYYNEKVAKVEMKIYPNPTTEKITFEFSGSAAVVENIRPLRLYSLTGQLLQTHPVQSETTTISLLGLAKGTYILKVQINNRKENWKMIKQ